MKSQSYISWSAVFAAAFAGVGINFLFNLLALAVGLASFTVTSGGKTEFSLAGFLCFGISALLSMFLAGWIAGKLTPPVLKNRLWGILYGFLAWSVILMITVILITNMIQYSAFHANFTSSLVAVKLTNNAPMLTETLAHQFQYSPLSFNIETGKKVITLNALLTFILFFLGSIASCVGGYLGYGKPPVKYE